MSYLDDSEKKFQCPKCGALVDFLKRMEIHIHEIHLIPVSETVVDEATNIDLGNAEFGMKETASYYKCPACGESFSMRPEKIYDLIRIKKKEE